MESALLLHERHQSLAGLGDKEGLFLGPRSVELGRPDALEVGGVGEDQLGVLSHGILRQKVLDVVLGDALHPVVDVLPRGLRILAEVLSSGDSDRCENIVPTSIYIDTQTIEETGRFCDENYWENVAMSEQTDLNLMCCLLTLWYFRNYW